MTSIASGTKRLQRPLLLGLCALLLQIGSGAAVRAQGAPAILWPGGGHTGVNAVAISPDGQTVATGSSFDETVKLWRASDGVLVRTLAAHIGGVQTVAFSPDGQFVASGADFVFGANDVNIKLWRVSDGTVVRTFQGAPSICYSVAFSPDGTLLAAGKGSSNVEIFRVSDGALLRTLTGHSFSVFSVAFSPNGLFLASGSGDNTIKLWRVSNGALVRTLNGHTFFVASVAFTPNGRQLVSGSWDQTVKVWNTENGALLRTLSGHTEIITAVACSADGLKIASASFDDTIKLWRVSNGTLVRTISSPGTGDFSSATFTPDSREVLSGGHDGHARFWRLEGGVPRLSIGHHTGPITAVAFSPTGDTFASSSKDVSAKIWDAVTGAELRTLSPGVFDLINSIAYTPDGTKLAGAVGTRQETSRLVLWDVFTGATIYSMFGHTDGTTAVDVSLDGSMIATGGVDGLVKLWQTSTGLVVRRFLGQGGNVTDVEFSPDGITVASSSTNGTIFIRRIADGFLIRTMTSSNSIAAFGYSSNGSMIATAESAFGNNVKLWNVATGGSIRTLEGHVDGFAQGVAFDPDGQTVVSGSGFAREIKFWRVSDGALLQTYDKETGWGQDPTFSVDYSPGGGASFGYGRNDATVDVAINPF